MENVKMTKRENLERILTNYAEDEILIAFANHELELLNKKNGKDKKPTKTQVENVTFKNLITDELTVSEKALSIKEIQHKITELSDLSSQKITSLLSQLVKEEVITKNISTKRGESVTYEVK